MSNASAPHEDSSPGNAPRSPYSRGLRESELGDNDGPTDDMLEHNKNKILREKEQLEEVLEGLDTKLNRVLKKQEHDYLRGYSIYVK